MSQRKRFRLQPPPTPKERDQQISDTNMLRILIRPGVAWTAIDHGHSINRAIGHTGQPIGLLEAQKRRARGVRSGIPDYLFWHQGRGFAIERKVDGGVVSDDQQQFITELREAGVLVSVCYDQHEICRTLNEWGLLRPGAY